MTSSASAPPAARQQPARAFRHGSEQRRNTSEGIASTASIQRQLSAPVVRRRSLEKKEAEIPMTIISWLVETRRPRRSAGAISAMYMGAVRIAAPTAIPAENTREDEVGIGMRGRGEERGAEEEHRGQKQHRAAAVAVAQHAGAEIADHGAPAEAAHRPAERETLRGAAEPEVVADERHDTGNHRRIESEQESAECRYERDASAAESPPSAAVGTPKRREMPDSSGLKPVS